MKQYPHHTVLIFALTSNVSFITESAAVDNTVGDSDNDTAQRQSDGNSTDVTEPEKVKCGTEYLGETFENMNSRHLWHQEKFDKNSSESYMANHMNEKHNAQWVKSGFFVQWVYWVYLFSQNTRPLCNAAMYEQV